MSQVVRNTIIVIEDDAAMLSLLYDYVFGLNYQVITFMSAEKALDFIVANEKFVNENVAMIISDVKLPGKDGLSVLSEVRNFFPFLPTVLITGMGAQVTVEEAKRKGAVGLVYKPFSLDEIRQLIIKKAV